MIKRLTSRGKRGNVKKGQKMRQQENKRKFGKKKLTQQVE